MPRSKDLYTIVTAQLVKFVYGGEKIKFSIQSFVN